MAFKPPPALPKLSAPTAQKSNVYSELAPDLGKMEANVGNAISKPRPKGWSKGKAAWKEAGGRPPGLAKLRPKKMRAL